MSWRGAWLTRVLPAALVTLALVIAAGCGSSGPEGTIALLLPERLPRFETHDRPEFEAKVEELCGDCKILYSNAQGNAVKQQEQAEAALAHGADVLVVDPVGVRAASKIVQRAKPQEVPVISYDELIVNARVDYYVDISNEELGKLQAETLIKKLREEGEPHGHIIAMTVGFGGPLYVGVHKTINPSGVKFAQEYVLPAATPRQSVSKLAKLEMQRAIAKFGRNGFAGVYTSTDELATGAIAAMQAAGIDPETKPTVGGGATIPGVQKVLDGKQFMTAYEATEQQAEVAAEMAVEILEGGKVDPSRINAEPANGLRDVPAIYLKPTPVIKETIKTTVIDNGFIKSETLCRGPYAAACKEAGIS